MELMKSDGFSWRPTGYRATFNIRLRAMPTGINLRDGLPDRFQAADIPLDENTAYQRLEVIKGPAGTLYGAHNTGGIVNKVSKFPLRLLVKSINHSRIG